MYNLDGDGKIDAQELEGLLLWAKKNKSFGSGESDGVSDNNLGDVSEIGMVRQENGVPTRDAFLIMPIEREVCKQVHSWICMLGRLRLNLKF